VDRSFLLPLRLVELNRLIRQLRLLDHEFLRDNRIVVTVLGACSIDHLSFSTFPAQDFFLVMLNVAAVIALPLLRWR
jgi:hypothetical protein